jgi:hypothetical protein
VCDLQQPLAQDTSLVLIGLHGQDRACLARGVDAVRYGVLRVATEHARGELCARVGGQPAKETGPLGIVGRLVDEPKEGVELGHRLSCRS